MFRLIITRACAIRAGAVANSCGVRELVTTTEVKQRIMRVVVDAGRKGAMGGGRMRVPTADLLEAVETLRATGAQLTERESTILLTSLGRHGECDAALRQLNDTSARNLFHYNAALHACSQTARWQDAMRLLNEMEKVGVVPDAISFNTAISACARAGRVLEAVDLLEIMTWEVHPACSLSRAILCRISASVGL